MLRIWSSPYSNFGKLLKTPNDLQDETVTAVKVYTDKVLSEIAQGGFNAIWVHGILKNIVLSEIFPEFGQNSSLHLRNMRALIKRAKKNGLKVFLYMQPPRALDAKSIFWKTHPDVAGEKIKFTTDDGYKITMYSLCTSTQKVKDYLRLSSARLVKELPGLGGVILITASEYPSHCYGRCRIMVDETGGKQMVSINCFRCRSRQPTDVITEIIQLIRDGIRNIYSVPDIIIWNWSWTNYERDPCSTIIRNLPKDVILMAGFERGGTKFILGKKRPIGEYSLSFRGPSKQFMRSYRLARKQGIEVMAKLQIGTTHELATVPSLPLVGNIYEKARFIRTKDLFGFMGCWNFGNMLSANTAGFNTFLSARRYKIKKQALSSFAKTYFPGCRVNLIVKAWEQFAKAMDNYPFSVSFLYGSPINYSLAYRLQPGQAASQPAGRSWQMDKRGDYLEYSIGEFNLIEIIRSLGIIMRGWKKATSLLTEGLVSSGCRHAQQECDNAWVCYHIFRSTWNTYRAYRLRRRWNDSKIIQYRRIIKNELSNLRQVLSIVERDSRFGFHAEAQAYMFDAKTIERKIRVLNKQIKKEINQD